MYLNPDLLKKIYVFFGILSLVLGFIGIFLPLLPTTPFLLLSAILFSKGSKKLHDWLINHKLFGKYIYEFTVEKAIPLNAKIISISMMWLSILFSVFVVANGKLWLQILLIAIALAISIHISLFKTKK